jgi:uncharacterized protein
MGPVEDIIKEDTSTMPIGDWIQTASGNRFWPLDPRKSEVHVPDIAHALAMTCRFGGHSSEFYSVAQHSVLMARKAYQLYDVETALLALLHDSAEAYLTDVPRPIKKYLEGFKAREDDILARILSEFWLPQKLPAEVKTLDNCILVDEARAFMGGKDVTRTWDFAGGQSLGLDIEPWGWRLAKGEFLQLFYALEHARIRARTEVTNHG